MRSASAAAAVAATTILGGGTADAGPQPHLRSVMELLENASRQLTEIEARGWPPGPCAPETIAALQSIRASSASVGASVDRISSSCRG